MTNKTLHGSFQYEGEPFKYHVEFTPKPRVEHKKTAYAYLINKFPQLKGLKPLSVEIYSYEIDEEAIKENIEKGGSPDDVITKERIIYKYPE